MGSLPWRGPLVWVWILRLPFGLRGICRGLAWQDHANHFKSSCSRRGGNTAGGYAFPSLTPPTPILELPREVLYGKASQSHVRAINQNAEDGQSTNLEIPELGPNEIESLGTATSNKAPPADSHVETWSCFLQQGKN